MRLKHHMRLVTVESALQVLLVFAHLGVYVKKRYGEIQGSGFRAIGKCLHLLGETHIVPHSVSALEFTESLTVILGSGYGESDMFGPGVCVSIPIEFG